MVQVFLGIGSNIEPDKYIRRSVNQLRSQFGELQISRVFRSQAIGFDGHDFLNLVVGFETPLALPELVRTLRAIEIDLGRPVDACKNSSRTIDLDILLYGDTIQQLAPQLPRAEITENAFVLWPLSELIPQDKHPILQQTYASLWQAYKRDQQLEPVGFDW